MGTFYTKCKIENAIDRSRSAVLSGILVGTGSEYTWVPTATLERIGIDREKKDVAFVMANGQQVTRSVGFAIIRLDKHFTVDEVVFAEKGDLLLLGARSLEGLNLIVDARRKKLVAAGPLPAALSGLVAHILAPLHVGLL
jgi:predicted aspartyl protease